MIATTGNLGKGASVGVVVDAETEAGAGTATALELEGRGDLVLSSEATDPSVPRIGFGPGARDVAGDGV